MNITKRAALAVALISATAVSAPAFAAETIGAPTTDREWSDTASNLTLILSQAFTTAGKLNSYSFFAEQAGDVTPLLFTRDTDGGTTNFTVSAIGTTRNVGAGLSTFDFGAVSGSNIFGADSYFGFRTSSLGVVSFDYNDGTVPGAFAKQQRNGDPVGSVFSFDAGDAGPNTATGLNYRTYSINATASAVPEPAAWALMIGGFGMVGGAMRRRKTSAKVTFA